MHRKEQDKPWLIERITDLAAHLARPLWRWTDPDVDLSDQIPGEEFKRRVEDTDVICMPQRMRD